ncbi:MAG: hypothetical protein PCFJNLEI_03247 [Verrucomicrobiae bacterium]|nr:hypothetical protein [Verrucomicrobiae bacterium]
MTTTTAPRTDWKKLNPPPAVAKILQAAPRVVVPATLAELVDFAVGGPGRDSFEVAYPVPGKGRVVEVVVARVRNGISANYVEPYMRRRDPDCMTIADELPTDKPRFAERFGRDFRAVRAETFAWLEQQDLAVFGFHAGGKTLGMDALVIAPANAGFFAFGLALLQEFIPLAEVPATFAPRLIIYVAPPFRHTHFAGRQMVVHARTDDQHEIFAYNLYPGPSAKKGVYGALITGAERDGWVVAHCSTVQVVTPYDNVLTIMHEGASGGGKSEMLELAHRELDGRLLLGRNLVTGEERHLQVPRLCELDPVNDDMALCHPKLQTQAGYLHLTDAETGWFVRVNHIDRYGVDPHLEGLTAQPPQPLLFLNIDAAPGSRALIWEHIPDAPGKPCPNPRVILPRSIIPNIVNTAVAVDVRSLGVRTPPCTREKPTYGIVGLFHVLPPALAWLWRLVAPRGHSNPSIVDTAGMSSEGVGSYWPFATGRKVTQANLLLEQILATPKTTFIITPNQHIGAWETGFMPQWIAREYLARRGHAPFKRDQLTPARCPLLGQALTNLTVEGTPITRWFLQVDLQPEVGPEAYDQGAAQLTRFFHQEIRGFLEPDLLPLGRQIIECCLRGGTVADYEALTR